MTTGTKPPRQALEQGERLPLVGEIARQRQEPAAAGLVAAACECLKLVRRARGNDGGPVRSERCINEMAATLPVPPTRRIGLPVRVVMAASVS
jgi:hypothetical protein